MTATRTTVSLEKCAPQMSAASLRKKIKSADGLPDALRLLAREHASGALVVKTIDREGSIALVNGRITAAALSPTGERGEEALDGLVDVEAVQLRYSKFYAMHTAGAVLDIPIEDYLDRISGPATAQPQVIPDPDVAAAQAIPNPIDIEEPAQPQAIDPVLAEPATSPTVGKVRKETVPLFPPVLLLGITALVCLAISAYYIPDKITSTAGGGAIEQRAKERLKESLHASLARDNSEESILLIPNRVQKRLQIDEAGKPLEEPMTEDLRFARYLVTKGKIAEAQRYYESYLKLFPDSIKPRLELANVYLSTKQRAEARLLCIRTFKRNLTAEEMGSVWQLLGQCQTD